MKIQSKLGAYDLTMIIISLVIGIGIFKTPGIVAAKAQSPTVFYLAWIIGGVVSILGALTFAEIGARQPAAGGFYKIFSLCYHPAFAFMINWAQLLALAGSAAAISLVGAEYIRPVILPGGLQPHLPTRAIALSVMSVLFVINYLGIKMSARVQNIFSGLKIVLILLLCIAAFCVSSASEVIPAVATGHNPLRLLGVALIPVFYSWNGYQYTINFGADVREPRRNIPFAIFLGTLIILVLYLLINAAYCQALGFSNLANHGVIAAELARKVFGEMGFKATSVIIFISVIGFLNTSLMSNPRVYYAMAEDGVLPPVFKRVNPRTQTQEFALFFFFALMVFSLIFLDTFEKILNDIIFINSLALIFGAASVFTLRSRMAGANYTGYTVRPRILVPVLFIGFLLFVCGSMVVSDPHAAMIGITLFVAGFPLFYLVKVLQKIKTAPDEKTNE